MMLRCRGRLRVTDGSVWAYMTDCYACARHCRAEIEDAMLMRPQIFEHRCPDWILKPIIDEANESWPEER